MNKIEKWILIQFRNLERELDGTYDEEEQEDISNELYALDDIYALVKNRDIVELEIIFHTGQGYKIYNIHAEKDSHYIEEYEGFTEDKDDLETFMETATLRDITEEIDLFELLDKAIFEEKAEIN